MTYTRKFFDRIDLQQVCTFLLEGLENFDIEIDTYENLSKHKRIRHHLDDSDSFFDKPTLKYTVKYFFQYNCHVSILKKI